MTDLISQLFDIATNEEFSPKQRKDLMALVLRGHKITIESQAVFIDDGKSPPSLMIDAALGRHLTKETLPNGGIRFGLASQLPSD